MKNRVINVSKEANKRIMVSWLWTIGAFAIIYAVLFYFLCPAINLRDESFYISVIVALVLSCGVSVWKNASSIRKIVLSGSEFKQTKQVIIIVVAVIAVFVIMNVISAPLFNAKRYRNRITVEQMTEEDAVNDLPSINDISKISLMDTDSAKKLGDRVLGSLTDVVSQFEVGEYYTIEINSKPMKIAPLEYGDFFKWASNKSSGIPGYVLVDPITSEAKFVKVDGGINYAPSGYFANDLFRHIRFKYPTKMLGNYTFQVDNDGNAYWVITTLKKNTALTCEKPEGVILCDVVSGDCKYYALKDVPDWVDQVFNGNSLSEYYDAYGRYVHGFINFSKKGITSTTQDYGYLCIDSDIYVYTGITSIAGDESNLGFILANSRTGEYRFYPISGAQEFSAMDAAEGTLQNYGYKASFPSLVNVDGIPTYVMVLKDSSNLVKMYAMVNVKNYTIVATADTLKECVKNYSKALNNAGTSANISIGEDEKKVTCTIENIEYITVDGNTYVYIKADNKKVYKQLFSQNEKLILLSAGDKVEISYAEDEDIITINSIEKK